MDLRATTRVLLTGLVCAGCLGVALPLSTGWWDPSWLRLADELVLDVRVGSSVEVGAVDAPFVVEQPDASGQVRWRLRGERLRGLSAAGPYEHEVVRPRLEVFDQGRVAARLVAERAEVSLPQGETKRIRIVLEGGVELEAGERSLRGRSLTLWFDPRDPGAARMRTREPAEVRLGEATLRCQAGEGRLAPLELDLRGPVDLESGTFARGQLAGLALSGRAVQGVKVDAPEPAPEGELYPERIRVRAFALTVRAREGERPAGRAEAERCELWLERAPLPVQAALGGPSGSPPGWSYAPGRVRAEGGFVAELRRAETAERGPLDVRVSGEEGELVVGQELTLRGAPAELEERTRGLALRAALVRADLRGDPRVEAEGEVRLRAREPLPADAAADAAPAEWEGSLARAAFTIAPLDSGSSAATTSASGAAAGPSLRWLTRLRAADLEGPLDLRRRPGPDRLAVGESLRWERTPQRSAWGVLRFRGGLRATLAARGASARQGQPDPPWSLAAEAGTLRMRDPATAPVGSSVRAWLERLEEGHLADLRVERAAPPPRAGRDPVREAQRQARRARRIVAQRASLTRPEGAAPLVTLAGEADVFLGAVRIAGPLLRFTPHPEQERGRVWGSPVELEVRRGEARYRLRSQSGAAELALDPAVWERDRQERKRARRAGQLLVRPAWLIGLRLEEGVEVSGSDELRGRAEQVWLEGEALVLSGAPLRVQDATRRLVARRAELSQRGERFFLLARGGAEEDLELAGVAGESPLWLRAGWLEAELSAPRGRPKGLTRDEWRAQRARARLPLGPFRAGGERGVALGLKRPDKAGARREGARELELRAGAVAGRGRAGSAERPAVELSLSGGWATQLRLPKRGPASIEGERVRLLLDLRAAREGARPDEPEESYARRLLRSLEARQGVALRAEGLTARAERADLDGERGVYVLRGEPAVVTRGGVSQRGREWVLRLGEE